MYKKVNTDLNFVQREKEIEQFWKDQHIFEKSIEEREGSDIYCFYDGPPTANGKPHIGHVLTRVIKDMIPRYQTMKGRMVPRKAGWDTHGLPVELEVERLLGLDGKDQIETYGLEPFIDKCKESVWQYKGMWEDFSSTVGFWADMEHPYVTYHNDYIESIWWSLKEIWNKGLLYKGFKTVPYCPRCGTPLSSQEVAQGYKDVKERSAIVRFKAVDEDVFFLAWTTTPWTLPSNLALCVNPNETYVKVKAIDGNTYILAEALAEIVLAPLAAEKETKTFEVQESYKGRELERRRYEPLYDVTRIHAEKQHKEAFYITCADFVTLTDGTGIVHIAPAFGEDDSQVGKVYDLPFVQLVDDKGQMKEDTPFAGTFVKEADPLVIKELSERGLLFAAPKFEHSYPHCWRCDTPLIYYARESWFIKMTAVKDNLIKNNNTIHWIPESIGKKRFGDWLENVQDWGISRNRYWGTPLPIWECADCGHQHAIGSIAELKEMSDSCPDDIELHRPYIDDVQIHCPQCNKLMQRVPEVIDCWYDSGAMPFAQHHYPFENKDLFEQQFPADFISEAVDQTRGWFYSLLAISTLLFDKAPYKNVIVLGHVQDENGQKMSKSKGNAVDPFAALEEYGADAIRWYFYVNSAPWLPNRFHGKAVVEGQRKFMGTLWNTYAFFVLYANIDGFDAANHQLEEESLTVLDRWLLSKLNTLIETVDHNLANYKIPESARALQEFVDDMSNWYVRRSRERFWAKGMEQDKINAYMTLYTALVTVAKVAAPMIPFMTEEIYQNLVRSSNIQAPESIHLCDFPTANVAMIDHDLEAAMDHVLKIVVMGRAARNNANIKNRQPIGLMLLKANFTLSDFYLDIIRDELNVKEIKVTEDMRDFTSYSFKPQLRTVGPKYGKFLGQIKGALEALDGNKAMDELKANGYLSFIFDGTEVQLSEEDLLIESMQMPGYVSEQDQEVTVVFDTNLSEALLEEGFVRELISKIQTMRKEAGFEVMDTITIAYAGSTKAEQIFAANADIIIAEVMATAAQQVACDNIADQGGYCKEWNINGESVTLSVTKNV